MTSVPVATYCIIQHFYSILLLLLLLPLAFIFPLGTTVVWCVLSNTDVFHEQDELQVLSFPIVSRYFMGYESTCYVSKLKKARNGNLCVEQIVPYWHRVPPPPSPFTSRERYVQLNSLDIFWKLNETNGLPQDLISRAYMVNVVVEGELSVVWVGVVGLTQ